MKDYKRMTVGEIVADNFNNAGIFDKYALISAAMVPHCFPKPVKLPEPIWRR